MMFISVDLPEPDVPMMATNSPLLDGQAHVAQRVHLDVAQPVDLDEVLGDRGAGVAAVTTLGHDGLAR